MFMDHIDLIVQQGMRNAEAKKATGPGLLALSGFEVAIRNLGARGPHLEQELLRRAAKFPIDIVAITERLRKEWKGIESQADNEAFFEAVGEQAREELSQWLISEEIDVATVKQLFATYRLTAPPYP